jgi:hypothetical protein
MKNSLKNLNLWQQKRNELPIDAEPQTGWAEMQSILDKHLPVLPIAHVAKVSKLAKAIKAVKTIKASTILLVSLTVATTAGVTIYLTKNKHWAQQHPHKKRSHINGRDSLQKNALIDSMSLSDTANRLQDSLNAASFSQGDTVLKNEQLTALQNRDSSGTGTDPLINHNKKGALLSGLGGNTKTGVGNANSRSTGSTVGFASGNHQTHNGRQSMLNGSRNGNSRRVGNNNRVGGKLVANDDQNPDQSTGNGNATLLLSAGTAQSWQLAGNVGGNSRDFTKPDYFTNQPLSAFTINSAFFSNAKASDHNKLSNKNKAVAGSTKGSSKSKKSKNASGTSSSPRFSNFDWGILVGANSSGSFTPKAQNSNIYGSFPIDVYGGLFASYQLNSKWAVNMQVRALTPLNLSGSYTHNNASKVDSGQLLKVTDSRKAYFVSIPIHAVYKVNSSLSIKGGPVINIPVKQINGNTSLQPASLSTDTVYYTGIMNQLKATKYDQKINLGLSGGVSVEYNRLIFEATYYKSFSGYNVKSDFGNYKSSPGSLQISVGFKLNRSKHH